MRKVALVIAAQVVIPSTAPALQAPEPVVAATVVARQYHRPPLVRYITTRFEPWSRPTPAQVHTIIAVEAARAGASAAGLTRRIRCESGFFWAANNGRYNGLGQFAASTFSRGMSSIGSRRVRMVARRVRAKRVLRRDTLADGTVSDTFRWAIRQRVVHIYRGMLPRHPSTTHGWAQVRIMAQALVGRSAVHNSEWECGA